MATYTSHYPTIDGTHVKATVELAGGYEAYRCCNSATPLTGGTPNNCWFANYQRTNQRFHIDLGSGHIIKRVYYENAHDSGASTTWGAQHCTFWGSNTVGDFNDLVYANNGTWVSLTISQDHFEQHVALNQADPQYLLVTNSTSYQYYAFKFADDYGGSGIFVRRIELQTEDAPLTSMKTIGGVAYASVKSVGGVAVASVKSVSGVQ